MNSPFKFLDAYELADKDAFFGREKETDALYQLVTQNRLTFVYGPSGIGKTSLVQCGLASRFDRVDWLPLFVRRGDDLNASLRREIGKALGQDRPFEGELAAAIDTLYKNYLRPVYLIFDQFEELFILGRDEEEEQERLPFFESIADLLDANMPCRILFIMREDYFGHLNQFEQIIPELYHRKIRVEAMSRDNLQAVITGSCQVFGIGFDDARRSPQRIMDNILAGKKGVHMPYVQVYLHILYQEALASEAAGGNGKALNFTDAIIRKVGPITDVLGRFLQEQKTLITRSLQQKPAFAGIPEDSVSQVLDVFVSGEGTKVPVSYTQQADDWIALEPKAAKALTRLLSGQDAAALISAIVLELEKSRILRRSDDTFELAHDTLAALIDQQRSVEQRQLRDVRQRIETGYKEYVDSNKTYFFDKGQLDRLEPFLPKLDLEPKQVEFLETSRGEAERLENEKEKERKRKAVISRVLAAVAIVAIAMSIFAFFQTQKAQAQADEILRTQAKVEDSEKKIAGKTMEVEESVRKTREKEEVARLALIAVEAEKTATAEQKRLAAENLVRAKAARQEAEKALAYVVRLTLKDADALIYRLDYAGALEKIRSAAALQSAPQEVSDALLEIVYFFAETGQLERANGILDTAARLVGRDAATFGRLSDRQDFRKAIQALSPSRLAVLDARYFPIMLDIPGGTDSLGSGKERHVVTLSPFKLAKTETTWWQYHLFCAAAGKEDPGKPAGWGGEGDNPVVNVNWYDAIGYANWLSRRDGRDTAIVLTGGGYAFRPLPQTYRLPTETEWEYAARAGQNFQYSGTNEANQLDKFAWYSNNSGNRTHPAAVKKPNAWGLYDMSGNVWEWCWDWYAGYDPAENNNPVGPGNGSSRVIRGGGWSYGAEYCRSAGRGTYDPGYRDDDDGFRLVFVP